MQWDKIVLLRIRYLQVIISKDEDNIQAHQEKSLDTCSNNFQIAFTQDFCLQKGPKNKTHYMSLHTFWLPIFSNILGSVYYKATVPFSQ